MGHKHNMAASTKSADSFSAQNMSNSLVSSATESLLNGEIGAEEHFCMVISALGVCDTQRMYTSLIKQVLNEDPGLHKELVGVFTNYFAQQGYMTVKNPGCELDEELDFELAVKMSLQDCNQVTGGSDLYEPHHFDDIPSHYMLNQNTNSPPMPTKSWSSIVGQLSNEKHPSTLQQPTFVSHSHSPLPQNKPKPRPPPGFENIALPQH